MNPTSHANRTARSGSALILALWVLLTLSLLIGGFAFDMRVEAGITSAARKRFQATYLARAGAEWAMAALSAKTTATEAKDETEKSGLEQVAESLKKGLSVNQVLELGSGKVTVTLQPEKDRFNVNKLTDAQWQDLLDWSGVPQEQWSELIDCFHDWVDQDEEHRLNGAEGDDPYYHGRGYKVKNAPVDTVDELLLIKGFTPAVVYGGPAAHEGDPPLKGLAQRLTTWDDGKIEINSADQDTFEILGLDQTVVDRIMELRRGPDGEAGTADDGLTQSDLASLALPKEVAERVSVAQFRFVRMVAVGQVGNVRYGIWAVLYRAGEGKVQPVFWREENML